jgi:hypothetical protein
VGAGILGWVAEHGELINLDREPSNDPRYKIGVHPTHSLLAMPVRSPSDEEVIAVAQVVNKNPYSTNGTFSLDDQKVCRRNHKISNRSN